MSFPLSANLARKLICDPVMAAKVLLNFEMDTFQAARFRYWWFTPTVMDHSGVSVGKSELFVSLIFLRLMLLPLKNKPRVVTAYYPSQGTAERVLLPKVEQAMMRSKVLRDQIRMARGGSFFQARKNVIFIFLRDGASLEIPAGDFTRDSANNASARFNDLFLDETSKMDAMGDGVSKELMQRNTQECFNPNHPVHANKTLFLAHAESPQHPYYKRYAGLRRMIAAGSQDHVVLTSSHKDFRGEFKRRFGQEPARKERIQRESGELDEAELAQIWDGLWRRPSKGLYPDSMRASITRKDLRPHLRRADDRTVYFLGWDTSSGAGAVNDWNAGVVTAATPVEVIPDMEPGYMRIADTLWFVRAVYAVLVPPGADVDQKSGLIHAIHLRFGLSGLMLDNRGGGTEVSQKLRESRQLINNEWREVTGLCRVQEAFSWPMADPIVSVFDRGEDLLRPWFGERFIKDNSGPVDYGHRAIGGMMRRGEIAWTPLTEGMTSSDLSLMAPEEQAALLDLEKCLNQFGNIGVKVDRHGQPVMSDQQFRRFANTGKKDGALAAMYSVLGLRAIIARGSASGRQSGGKCLGVF